MLVVCSNDIDDIKHTVYDIWVILCDGSEYIWLQQITVSNYEDIYECEQWISININEYIHVNYYAN